MSQDELLLTFCNPIFKICLTSLLSLSFEYVGLFKITTKRTQMDEARAILEAKNLLIESEAGKTRPVNLDTIITELGLKAIYKEDMNDYALLNPLDKTIYVFKNDQPIRDKLFAIAHEIGHWMLHSRDRERPRLNLHGNEALDQTLIEEEKEANSFAFELLMPYEETRNLIIFGYSVNYIASHFGVPIEKAYMRYNEIYYMVY